MSNRHLFWAVAAMAAMPLFAATTTDVYTFRYSTLDRAGELAVRATSEATGLSFELNAETFDKAIGLAAAGGPAGETVTEWRPVAFVPPTVTVTAISVAIPGTDAPAFITVTPKDDDPVEFRLGDATETVSLVDADGIAHTATLRTYEHETGVTLQPNQDYACRFAFDDTEVDATTRNFYTFDGAPHLRVTGTASITRHVLNISDGREHSFATLADFDESMDQADQVFVVEFSGSGGTLTMDAPLQEAPLVRRRRRRRQSPLIRPLPSRSPCATARAVKAVSRSPLAPTLRSIPPPSCSPATSPSNPPSTSRRMRGSPRTTSPSPRAAPSVWSSPARWAPRTTCRTFPSPMPPAVWNSPPTP